MRLLVLCSHNSARSQMAEGWLRHYAGELGLEAEGCSAGTEKTFVKPDAVAVMAERSTKARVSTPATHVEDAGPVVLENRSTKARVSTPATLPTTRELEKKARALNEGQGINPGDTRFAYERGIPCRALNEGQGINPGDTVYHKYSDWSCWGRSTKARVSTPATPPLR